jgi:nitronate monooxygenase
MTAADRIRALSRWPIVVSPMAGGPTGPALVIAAARAGALPFLAAGNKTPTAMEAEIDAVRRDTDAAFGVNVFVPGNPSEDAAALTAYLGSLEAEAAALGTELGAAAWDDDGFEKKLERLLGEPPPIVSFTFGCPPSDAVRTFRSKGVVVVITVTTPDEAVLALRAGADSLCLQGSEAGGHRAAFVNGDGADQDYPLLELLSRVLGRTDVPLIAAGGIAGPDDVATVLAAGAVAAQAGTAFLRCSEGGANPAYQRALADSRFSSTAITRAFSGRRARGLVNQFMREHEGAPRAYPEINNATRPLRAAAAASDDPDHMSLYAGVNFRRAEARRASEIIAELAAGVDGGPGGPGG